MGKIMQSIIVKAKAKINWTLDILGTNQDGYHVLDMLMQTISLFDKVEIIKQEQFELKTDKKYIPCDERNTAFRAAQYFFDAIGKEKECLIKISKKIPSGAGLGGGSADAAAVLNGLNQLYGYPLSQKTLSELALKIGADVPFLLKRGFCRAKGIGEQMQELAPKKYVLLLAMDFSTPISTKNSYKLYDELKIEKHPDTDGFIKALNDKDFDAMRACGGNSLIAPSSQLASSVPTLIQKMYDEGATFSSMTGSGSTVFGVFKSVDEALKAKKNFCDVWCRAVYTDGEE